MLKTEKEVAKDATEELRVALRPFVQRSGDLEVPADELEGALIPALAGVVERVVGQDRAARRLDDQRRREAWSGT
jgi:hypothetical protein